MAARGACERVRLGRWELQEGPATSGCETRDFTHPAENGIARPIPGPVRPQSPQDGRPGGRGDAPRAGDGAGTTCGDDGSRDDRGCLRVMDEFFMLRTGNRFFVRVKTMTQKSGTRVAFPREIHTRPSSPYLVIARGLVAIIVQGGTDVDEGGRHGGDLGVVDWRQSGRRPCVFFGGSSEFGFRPDVWFPVFGLKPV